MPTLQPVDSDPFAASTAAPKLEPVDHDPFAAHPATSYGHTAVEAGPRPGLEQFGADFLDDTASNYHAAAQANRKLFRTPLDAVNPLKVYEGAGNALDAILSPVAGGAEAVATAANPKLRDVESEGARKKIGGLATSLVPLGGGEISTAERGGLKVAKTAEKVSEEALHAAQRAIEKERVAAPDVAHHESVKGLTDAGFNIREMTPGMIKGGEAKRGEEAAKSKPTSSGPIRAQEQRAVRELNRTWYEAALKPIGQKFTGDNIGHEGVDEVESKISAVYDRYLPFARGQIDPELVRDLASIKAIDPEDQAALSAARGHILARFKNGAITGDLYKIAESDLTKLATNYRGQGKILLADHVDDLNAALRDNIERNSPKGVREKIKDANTSWAIFKRIQSAASRRAGSDGIASAEDFIQAVRKTDKSKDKGAFARGDALMQDLARHGKKVLGNVVSDSGTTERAARNSRGIVGGMAGAAAGSHFGPFGAAAGAEAGSVVDRALGGVGSRVKDAIMKRRVESLAKRHAAGPPQNDIPRVGRPAAPLVNHRLPGRGLAASQVLRTILSPQPEQP